jgi:hypothetical protein
MGRHRPFPEGPPNLIPLSSARWAYTLGCQARGIPCPFEPDDARAWYWLGGRDGKTPKALGL